MSETINYYEIDSYPRDLIRDFVRSQRNLAQAPRLSSPEVKDQDIRLHGSAAQSIPDGPIDLFYRFTDDEVETPALGFREHHLEGETDLYLLVYIDPSIEALWKHEMDRERERE